MTPNPFQIAADIIFNNPHFTETITIPGKGSFPAIRGQETVETINANYGVYDEVACIVTVQLKNLTVVGIPRKDDLCFFDSDPNRSYRVLRTVLDSACQTVDIILGESMT